MMTLKRGLTCVPATQQAVKKLKTFSNQTQKNGRDSMLWRRNAKRVKKAKTLAADSSTNRPEGRETQFDEEECS